MSTARYMQFTLLLMSTLSAANSLAQQVADTSFRPHIERPAYPLGRGPVVLIDEAHSNFHTAAGRYLPFAELLRRDGYIVKSSVDKFTAKSLQTGSVLVIANALNENQGEAGTPILSAFTVDEIAALQDWVAGGGALFLIADHRPWPGAADSLARAFRIRFHNGVAVDWKARIGRLIFRRSDRTLIEHAVTKAIDSIATFSGSAFQVEAAHDPLLVFGPRIYSYTQSGDSVSVEGHLQGALLLFGEGRIAVFGEAAMFSAQLAGPDKYQMGMNAPIAKQNWQFLLNVMHWLTGVL